MPESLEQILARQLRRMAAERAMPLSHLADASGLARSYLWRLLDAKSSATLDTVQRLADTLHVDPRRLLIGAEPFHAAATGKADLVVADARASKPPAAPRPRAKRRAPARQPKPRPRAP